MNLHYKTALLLALAPVMHAADIFGRGHGLDHVGIVVHDLAAAENIFRDLGFKIGGRGWLPDGTIDTSIDLKNQGQYLELIKVTDREKASVRQGDLVRFSEKGEGPFFVGLDVSSAAHAAAFLRKNGWKVDGPAGNSWTLEGVMDQFPEGWLRVRIALPIFFMEYHDRVWKQLEKKYPQLKEDPKLETHANGATALRAAWIGVKDLDSATRDFERAGLARGRRIANGQEMQAGAGSILLLEGGEGSVTGVTLEVSDLEQTQRVVKSQPYNGPFGRCVLTSAIHTKIEFCEKHH